MERVGANEIERERDRESFVHYFVVYSAHILVSLFRKPLTFTTTHSNSNANHWASKSA